MYERKPVVLTGGLQGAPAASAGGTWTNSYCANCLRTRRFYDRLTHLVCETCNKLLHKVVLPRRSAG